MTRREPFYGRRYGNSVRPWWWALLNRLQGYRWGAVQRHRCCGHTTPNHYVDCPANQGRDLSS